MKKSISRKLFVITSVSLIIFITITMYLQSTFFESFYTKQKTIRFRTSVEQFTTLYTNNYISDDDLSMTMRKFEERNNAKIILFTRDGRVLPANGQQISDKDKISAINKVFYEWYQSPNKLKEILKSNATKTYNYYDTDADIYDIVCIVPTNEDVNYEAIMAVSSLQPIEEASQVIKQFYFYVLVGVMIVIILLSLLYTNMITKPLIKLNKTASKMSEMDFSVQCDVKGEDEIGNLGTTLNFLSQNLNAALSDLRQKNMQLQEDIDKERMLDKMRKEFVAGVSHELKTPIALIAGYAEGLKDDIVDESSKNFYVDVIIDEADKMSKLVTDLLDLSQLESGNFKLKIQEIFLDQLLYKAINRHKQFMESKNILFESKIDGDLLVVGDGIRIEQVITNFLTNAIRHTPEGGKIRIETREEAERIYIQIENTGDKIPEDEMKNIWDKFYKIDKSRTRIAGGTGLGLSIVRNLLMLHNSTFGVKNTEEGVCFYFTLNKVA